MSNPRPLKIVLPVETDETAIERRPSSSDVEDDRASKSPTPSGNVEFLKKRKQDEKNYSYYSANCLLHTQFTVDDFTKTYDFCVEEWKQGKYPHDLDEDVVMPFLVFRKCKRDERSAERARRHALASALPSSQDGLPDGDSEPSSPAYKPTSPSYDPTSPPYSPLLPR